MEKATNDILNILVKVKEVVRFEMFEKEFIFAVLICQNSK